MGTIRAVQAESAQWRSGRDVATEWGLDFSTLTDDDLASDTRILQHGSDNNSELHEARFPPGAVVSSHAHDCEEVIYITEGELRLGNQVYGPGSSVFVSENTLYSFKAGPEGLKFLNYRPRGNVKYISKEEFSSNRQRARS